MISSDNDLPDPSDKSEDRDEHLQVEMCEDGLWESQIYAVSELGGLWGVVFVVLVKWYSC